MINQFANPHPDFLLVGNWKMHGNKRSIADLLLPMIEAKPRFKRMEWVVCPPFLLLAQCEKVIQETNRVVTLGAQNVSEHEDMGAYTGEVSAGMLKEFDCHYVLVGHSERRLLYGESNEQVAAKAYCALQAKITPIVCVGESKQARLAGKTQAVIAEQLEPLLQMHHNGCQFSDVVIAYEPIWAIGTGQQPQVEAVVAVHQAIRHQIKAYDSQSVDIRIIYGGSVNAKNAAQFCRMPDINGLLVGKAALDVNQFLEIGKQCNY